MVSIEKYKAWVYQMTTDSSENATVIVSPSQGDMSISVNLTAEDAVFHWGNRFDHNGGDLRRHIARLDMHSLAGLLGVDKWFDHAATIHHIKTALDEHHTSEGWEDSVCFDEELEHLEDAETLELFKERFYYLDYMRKVFDTSEPPIQYDVQPAFRRFYETFWPTLAIELKNGL